MNKLKRACNEAARDELVEHFNYYYETKKFQRRSPFGYLFQFEDIKTRVHQWLTKKSARNS